MGEKFIYIIIGAIAALLYWVCDKLQILKSKPLRILAALFVSSLLCWLVYDLVISAE